MKTTMMAFILVLLVGTVQAQESDLLPCAPWRAFNAAAEPTTLLGEAQRRQLIDESFWRVQRIHVDPEFDGVDLDELRQAYGPRIEAAQFDHDVVALIDEMLNWVDAGFISREEQLARSSMASFTGVGVLLSIMSDGHVLGVNYVYPGSPAEAAGLARGDRIVGVDQHSVCPHPNHIRGPAGTDVTLMVSSHGEAPRPITITRAPIEPVAPPRALRLDEPGIGYLWPGDFGAPGHPTAIRAALDDIGAFSEDDPLDGLVLDGLVLDLRGALGSDPAALDAIRSLAGLFTDGLLAYRVDGSARFAITATAQRERLEGVPLVILVDTATDDFHGMLAGAMQKRQRAQIVGQPVRGAWRLYRFESLPDGSQIVVPSTEIELLDGTRPRQGGLIPDSVMAMDWRDFPEHEDPYVAEAIRLIRTAGLGTD